MSDLFDNKAADWDAGELKQKLSQAIGSAIVKQLPLNHEMSVMDFGAGTGLICAHVAPHVKKIVAVDISPAMLAKLAEKPELQGKVTTACQDILEQPLSERFDLIVSAMAMHHVEQTDTMLQSFANHLNTGGVIALADLDKEDGSFHPADVAGVYHDGFERSALQKSLENHGFADIQFQTALTITKESKSYPIFLLTGIKI